VNETVPLRLIERVGVLEEVVLVVLVRLGLALGVKVQDPVGLKVAVPVMD